MQIEKVAGVAKIGKLSNTQAPSSNRGKWEGHKSQIGSKVF